MSSSSNPSNWNSSVYKLSLGLLCNFDSNKFSSQVVIALSLLLSRVCVVAPLVIGVSLCSVNGAESLLTLLLSTGGNVVSAEHGHDGEMHACRKSKQNAT